MFLRWEGGLKLLQRVVRGSFKIIIMLLLHLMVGICVSATSWHTKLIFLLLGEQVLLREQTFRLLVLPLPLMMVIGIGLWEYMMGQKYISTLTVVLIRLQ